MNVLSLLCSKANFKNIYKLPILIFLILGLLPGQAFAIGDPFIDIEKATNGVDADDPNADDAPLIAPGDLVTWVYVVTNTGDVPLSNVAVSDDQGVAVSCPQTDLAVGESMICTASGLAEDLASTSFTTVPGQCGGYPNTPLYENIGEVTGRAQNGDLVDDVDPSHYCNPPDPVTLIHDIQGSGSASPIDGQIVLIEGIVVGDFQDNDPGNNGDLNGFFVQEEDADTDGNGQTSEGIFVFDGSSPAVNVAIGDKVAVTGRVDEFFGLTELTNVSDVTVISSGNAAPTAASVSLPTDDFEPFEGMSVTFPQSLTIVEYFNFDRFGEMVLATDRLFQPTAIFAPGSIDAADLADLNNRSRITLDDGRTSQNPDPAIHPNGNTFDLTNRFRGGDLVTNATGVLNYSFDLYRIQPTQGADYTAVNLRKADHEPVGGSLGSLEVASFNVLNYFTTLNSRGADNADEFTRQRDKIFAALGDIDADVVGLIEIENNGTALTDLVAGLNNLVGAGTYAALDTGPIGGDEITVAFIYKPSTVSTVGSFAVLDTPAFVNPIPNTPDPKNRPALAQTFIDNSTGGVFTAVVNHLKSRSFSSGCGVGDDDPEQGGCNLTRTMAAEELAIWLATDPTGSNDPDVLILGDLNAYDKEDPIYALDQAGYADLVAIYGGEFAYSYVFSGQFGYLDYAMANADLASEVTGATTWHINSDEPDLLDYDTSFKKPAQDALYEANAYRASDHDPVIVGLAVCDEIAPTVQLSLTPNMLWPPNHKYVDIAATVVSNDNFDQNPVVTLLSVTSNEPDNGKADGNTINDIVIVDETHFKLRAERSGKGNGRTYTVTYQVTDSCGNLVIESAEVMVPKNRGKK